MAYISTEDVKEIRARIRKQFPSKDGWKISVRRENGTSVNVDILTAPIDFSIDGERYYQVNDFYIEEHYRDYPEIKEVLFFIKNTITDVKENWNRNANDPYADYADYNYFIHISVGQWDKPFRKI